MENSIEVHFTPHFVRSVKKMPDNLLEDIFDKVELLKNRENHIMLKVHKLNGSMKDLFSFSVNFKIRIIFKYVSKNEVVCMFAGDHDGVY